MDKRDAPLDESPTDELPVLTEVDVVDLDASSILLTPEEDDVDVILPGADDELSGGTGRFPRPDDLPDVEAFPELDDEVAFLRRRILLLEATLDDKEAENASLAERLRATRDAVERRDETERLLRTELAEAASERRRLEARLAEADALASKYADKVAELTSRLRTLEQSIGQRDAAFAELEAELIAREAAVVERERALALTLGGEAPKGAAPPTSELEPSAAARAGKPRPAPKSAGTKLEAALAGSREEAASLAAYIDCRRAHWLALEAELEEHRVRLRELEQEVEQRTARERRETERAEAEARRADALRTELAQWKARPGAADDTADGAGPERTALGIEPAAAEPEEAPTATLRVQRPPDRAREMGAGRSEPLGAALFCLTSDPPAEHGIGADALLIGRGTHCDIRIPTHFVSREHARIVRERDQIVIEDLGSKNGVFVNAVRVDRGALRHGDLVTIGETQFRFEAEPSDAAASA